jgi:hypothetical protein
VPEDVFREHWCFVLGFVLDQDIVCRLLDGFPPLVARLFLDDLAIALPQSLALAAILLDDLRLVAAEIAKRVILQGFSHPKQCFMKIFLLH